MHHPTEIDRQVQDKQVRYRHQAYEARRLTVLRRPRR
jgi:hypothetical protein